MSMLAERKQKQRWILNPRGKLWAEDKNGFGHKMLQKMGWSHGKGLGANEDGMTESLKVNYKNDSKGMGYKEIEEWTQHGENFAGLLESLRGENTNSTENTTVSSLEKKSQNVKARIHYHKFAKGKDLSRYSEKDLANILGKKTLKSKPADDENVCDVEDPSENKTPVNENLLNKGSMTDYFKKKLSRFGRNELENGFTKDHSDSEYERMGFGFESVTSDDIKCERNDSHKRAKKRHYGERFTSNFDEGSVIKQKKKNKKVKQHSDFVSYVDEIKEVTPKDKTNTEKLENNLDENIQETFETNVFNFSKKKKKNKEKSDQLEAEDTSQDKIEGLNEEYVKSFKRKKSRKHLKELSEDDNSQIQSNTNKINGSSCEKNIDEENINLKSKMKKSKKRNKSSEENCQELENDKKTKKIKEENGVLNPAFNDFSSGDSADMPSQQIDESMIKVDIPERKKKNHKKCDRSTHSIPLQEVCNNDVIQSEDIPKKKKKKHKANELNEGIDNPNFEGALNEFSNMESLSNPYEIKIKKKKQNKNSDLIETGLDNPALNVDNSDLMLNITSSPDSSVNPYEVKTKKRKSKSSHIAEEIGIDNPALNIVDVNSNSDLILNVVNTPILSKKNFMKSDQNSENKRSAKRKSVRFSDINEEKIIPYDPSERTNEYLFNRQELFDNTQVVEESDEMEMKKQDREYIKDFSQVNESDGAIADSDQGGNSCAGFVNNGFDIKCVDKVSFFKSKYEIEQNKSTNDKGVDNIAFNKLKNHIEENVESISNVIDNYQAEVENDINEAKNNKQIDNFRDKRNSYQSASRIDIKEWLVGDVGTLLDKSIQIEEGSKLSFKECSFQSSIPRYLMKDVSKAKKPYRHLIRGDITVGFKNSNLHDITGYPVGNKKREDS